MTVTLARKWVKWAILLVVAVLVWIGIDLYRPVQSSLREFDPQEVARLETDMWRAYYNREQVRLFGLMATLLRSQYELPFLRSNVVAYYAARAAFVFKDGQRRNDYEKALQHLRRYYQAIRDAGDIPFDVERASQLELEWWIVHRERDRYPAGALDRALADGAAAIYQLPSDDLIEHGKHRAAAMVIRDTKWEAGGVTEEDWVEIQRLLEKSWNALRSAVQNN